MHLAMVLWLYALVHRRDVEQNGRMAGESLARSNRVMHAWLKLADPVTGLLPRMESNPNWVVRDSAADLYPLWCWLRISRSRTCIERVCITFCGKRCC